MMNLRDALDEFLLAARADGLATKTVDWYRYTLAAMVAGLEALGITDLRSVTTNALRQYIADLHDRQARYQGASQRRELAGGLSPASIAGHVRAAHRFWSWCEDEYTMPNPMRRIRRKALPQRTVKAVAPADFVALFNATADGDLGARDRALLGFMIDTGARLGGVRTLRTYLLDVPARRARVLEKGSKTRPVVFSDLTAELLMQWGQLRPSGVDHVFTTATGRPLTDSGLHEIFRRLKRRAGVTGRVNPHAHRHGFARLYMLNGGDLATLSRLMGHSTIDTTMIYLEFAPDDLAQVHERVSPLKTLLKA